MAYSIEDRAGRFHVVSPAGKKWKTTYASRGAAEKAVAYIQGRYGGSSSPEFDSGQEPTTSAQTKEEADEERKTLGIPAAPDSEPDTEGW